MTTTKVGGRLAELAERIEQLRREEETAAAEAQAASREVDRAREELQLLLADRGAAPDRGATIADLEALDGRIAAARRVLDVAAAEGRRVGTAGGRLREDRERLEEQLRTGQRRRRELPRRIDERRRLVKAQRREIEQAERRAADYRTALAQTLAELAALEREDRALRGNDP